MNSILRRFTIAGLFALLAHSASALIIEFEQVGADIVIRAYGVLDTDGATFHGNVDSGVPEYLLGGVIDKVVQYSTGDDVYKIGEGGNFFSNSFSGYQVSDRVGDSFGLYAFDAAKLRLFYVSSGFSSGSISGSMTVVNQPLANLGLIPQVFSWGSNPGQSIELRYAAVPEPSTYALIFGLIAIGCVFVRRRRVK